MSTFSGKDGVVKFATSSVKISAAEGINASGEVIFETASAHGLTTGDIVVISNVTGFETSTYENPNGVFEVTVSDTETFQIDFACDDVFSTAQADAYVWKSEAEVAEVTDFTATESMEPIEDTAMGDSFRSHIEGLKTWEATVNCHWDDTDTAQEITRGTAVAVTLYWRTTTEHKKKEY